MEGLFYIDSEGTPQLCSALSYNLSEDGTLYTFKLNPDIKWSNDENVTAHDYEFAFKRMFGLNSLSSNAQKYISIKNASAILNEEKNASDLGINAIDDFTLEIQLDLANPYFTRLLALPSAVPCNQVFLESCKGRYGLDSEYMIFNGPFKVSKWNDEIVQIRKNDNYYKESEIVSSGVNFYIKRGNAQQLFIDKMSDCTIMSTQEYYSLTKDESHGNSINNTLWAITYNQNNSFFANADIRHAFNSSAYISEINDDSLIGFSGTDSFIPNDMNISEKNYREITGKLNYSHLKEKSPLEYITAGYEEININKAPKLTLLLPDNEMGKKMAVTLQEVWAKELAVFVNLEYLPENKLLSRAISGSYDLAILPYHYENGSPVSMLDSFIDPSTSYSKYTNEMLQEYIFRAMHSKSILESANYIYASEQTLINDSVIYPIYSGSVVFVMADGVENVIVSVFDEICNFKFATKK